MFENNQGQGSDIGQRNIEVAQLFSQEYGFKVVAQHVGGQRHRSLIFELWTGNVWCRARQS